jgi:hypothetical protein
VPTTSQNVLILYPHAIEKRDAVAVLVRDLQSILEAEGHNAELFSMSLDREAGGHYNRNLEYCKYLLRAIVHATARSRSLDAIIAVDVPAGVRLVGVLPRLLSRGRIRLVSWVLDLYSLQVARRGGGLMPRNRIRMFWDNLGLKISDAVVTLGTCMDAAVTAVAPKATSIPLWRDPIDGGSSTLREQLGISSDTFTVLYTGSAGPNHPLGALVDAAAALEGKEDMLLLLAGRGSEIEKARAASAGLSNVRFIEPVDQEELPALLNTGDLHVAVLDERMTGTCVPSKAYAAMASGKPCLFLGSDKSQVAHDIVVSSAGRVAATADAEMVRTILAEYAADRSMLQEHGSNGLELMRDLRSRKRVGEAWTQTLSRG